MPDLDLVSVRISKEDIGFARAELALFGYRSSSPSYLFGRSVDVGGIDKPETKVYDTAACAGLVRVLLENDHIPASGCLGLYETVLPVHRDHSKHLLIKPQRPFDIAHRESNMRQPMGLDHVPSKDLIGIVSGFPISHDQNIPHSHSARLSA
jgi:hypothetical protein